MCVPGTCGSPKRVPDPRELELRIVVNHHVGMGALRGQRPPHGAGVSVGCDWCWESDRGPLEDHCILLTADLSFQPSFPFLYALKSYSPRGGAPKASAPQP